MSTPPAGGHLPRYIEPRKLARQGVDLTGIIDADQFKRLAVAVGRIDSPVGVDLSFAVDDGGITTVIGRIWVVVELTCQRCLGLLKKNLDGAVHIGVAWSEAQAKQLPSSFDPWILSGEDGDLYQLIEDELILSLPMFANHEEANCQDLSSYSTESSVTDVSEAENPFSILERLKH